MGGLTPQYKEEQAQCIFTHQLTQIGYVANRSKWHIEPRPDEAHQLLFWNYYLNRKIPKKIFFGTGLLRYLSDIKAAQILKDIIRVKKSPAEKAFAQDFLDYFCKTAGLDQSSIPEPSGALKL